MKLTTRALTQAERLYTYAQSQQILTQTGMIGYLRGDFGNGQEFYTTWFDQNEARKTTAFQAELNEVINSLRFDDAYGKMLSNRNRMAAICAEHPGSAFDADGHLEYGIRAETQQYAYLFRCNRNDKAYSFYCWCYEKQWLDRHLNQASQGIRFIDPLYHEKFRIPDGDKIRIIDADGNFEDRVCRYIDEYHVEIGGQSGNLYHICQFAELMEQTGKRVIPMRSSLPDKCFGTLQTSREVILLRKGVMGYERTYIVPAAKVDPKAAVDALNELTDITKAQSAAMLAGSMFGWDTPAADPKNYDEMGQPVLPKSKDCSAR